MVRRLANGSLAYVGTINGDLSFFSQAMSGARQLRVALLDETNGEVLNASCATSELEDCDWRANTALADGDDVVIGSSLVQGTCSFAGAADATYDANYQLGFLSRLGLLGEHEEFAAELLGKLFSALAACQW